MVGGPSGERLHEAKEKRMNRPLKIILWVTAAIIVLFAALLLYVAFFFNANNYRGEIAAQVESATGRSLHIGSIHLSMLPVLGLKLSNTVLGNPKGFGGAPLAKVGEAAIGVRLLPLLIDHRLEINSIYLSGLVLNLRKKLNGKTNWSDMMGTQQTKTVAQKTSGSHESGKPPFWTVFAVAGVRVENASIQYENAGRDQSFSLNHVDLSAGTLRSGEPCSFRISFVTQSKKPAVQADVDSSGDLMVDFATHHFSLRDYRLKMTATGPLVPRGSQFIALHGSVEYSGVKRTVDFKHVTFDLAGVTSKASGQIHGLGTNHQTWEARIVVEQFNPSDAFKALGVADYHPKDASVLKKASLVTDASGSSGEIRLKHLQLVLDQTKMSGEISAQVSSVPSVSAVLEANNINVDRYLPAANSGTVRLHEAGSRSYAANQPLPLPLVGFGSMAAHCRLTVKQLTFHGAKLSNAVVGVDIAPHGNEFATLQADLYGGRITSRTRIGSAGLHDYQQTLFLSHVSIGPLLQDFMGRDPVSGQGDVSAELKGAGRTVGALERSLNGTVKVALRNGAVKGFNIAAILRNLQNFSQFRGQSTLYGAASNSQQTDFSSLSATGHISHGILTSNDLRAASPFLRASGTGTINLVKKTIDYTLNPVLVNTATGQGGKQMSQLSGVEIPVRITGPLSAPQYQIALGKILRQMEKKGLHQLLNQKNTTLQNRLKKLFGF